MCGIFGYIGNRNAVEILLDGLRRLEYRGYDSAGLVIQTPSGLEVRRSAGRIDRLDLLVAAEPLSGSVTTSCSSLSMRPTLRRTSRPDGVWMASPAES